jgi:hypothetical protein
MVVAGTATGCRSGSNSNGASPPEKTSSIAAFPSHWVPIGDCDAVEALIAAAEAGGIPDARTSLIGLNLGGESRIRLTEDGMWGWIGGGLTGTAACPKR